MGNEDWGWRCGWGQLAMAAKEQQQKNHIGLSHRYLPRRDLLSLQGSQIEVLRLRCRKESCEVNMLICELKQKAAS